jgi:hypothetical protein
MIKNEVSMLSSASSRFNSFINDSKTGCRPVAVSSL